MDETARSISVVVLIDSVVWSAQLVFIGPLAGPARKAANAVRELVTCTATNLGRADGNTMRPVPRGDGHGRVRDGAALKLLAAALAANVRRSSGLGRNKSLRPTLDVDRSALQQRPPCEPRHKAADLDPLFVIAGG